MNKSEPFKKKNQVLSQTMSHYNLCTTSLSHVDLYTYSKCVIILHYYLSISLMCYFTQHHFIADGKYCSVYSTTFICHL